MVPGEYRVQAGEIELNQGKRTARIIVVNKGDRPIQVGSHYHFFEVNRGLAFDRETAFGMRLDIPAGTAVRFEPGEEKPVQLVTLGGAGRSYGLNGLTRGDTAGGAMPEEVKRRLEQWKEGVTT
ncbi:urease subunit beta [Paenibacillus doosanensis]|uniref:urease subunit beta n=1 Tax=Paenibacillus doosanensis TaxID=1229154 RepID=UPI00217F8200|nr:urease subunit beta [Paenibacillus doosanensis]MCS7460274.1 urease subunit beta [Paenibacillus doosanensis]